MSRAARSGTEIALRIGFLRKDGMDPDP